MVLAVLFAIVASNWDLTLGYAGIFNFAHVGFFGIAGYLSAILTMRLGVPGWIAMVVAAGLVAMLACLIAFLALRLRGIYVALVTFAFMQLCVALIISQRWLTGGAVGMVGVPDLTLLGVRLSQDPRNYLYLSLLLLAISTFTLRAIVTSAFGLSLVALRDNENYAVSRGISVRRQHILAMTLSSVFPALAGSVYAHYMIVASPDVFSFSLTILVLSMTIVGGTGTIFGPIAGAVIITWGTEQMAGLGPARFMIVAVLIVLTLRFLPGGLWSLGGRIKLLSRAMNHKNRKGD
jgi:branched-chain amino acid transport system permease protein